jgi:hypothetical protein
MDNEPKKGESEPLRSFIVKNPPEGGGNGAMKVIGNLQDFADYFARNNIKLDQVELECLWPRQAPFLMTHYFYHDGESRKLCYRIVEVGEALSLIARVFNYNDSLTFDKLFDLTFAPITRPVAFTQVKSHFEKAKYKTASGQELMHDPVFREVVERATSLLMRER